MTLERLGLERRGVEVAGGGVIVVVGERSTRIWLCLISVILLAPVVAPIPELSYFFKK